MQKGDKDKVAKIKKSTANGQRKCAGYGKTGHSQAECKSATLTVMSVYYTDILRVFVIKKKEEKSWTAEFHGQAATESTTVTVQPMTGLSMIFLATPAAGFMPHNSCLASVPWNPLRCHRHPRHGMQPPRCHRELNKRPQLLMERSTHLGPPRYRHCHNPNNCSNRLRHNYGHYQEPAADTD